MVGQYLEFERPIVELENRLEELRRRSEVEEGDFSKEIEKLEKKIETIKREVYGNLNRWQITQLARHPDRPYTLDYVKMIFSDFIEIHGDRLFRDDPSIVAGFGEIEGRKVVLVGQQKGRTTKDKLYRNFGMPHPEGYRKALRAMKLAEKFSLPVLTFVDTPGAYPGIGAEERGQAEAIARNIMEMAGLKTPIVVAIIGEGGSGGALALGVGDRILMMEYAIYSVISPEGCASILWKDAGKGETAAEIMKISARDLEKFGIVDVVVEEPEGGAHRNPEAAAENLKREILSALDELEGMKIEEIVNKRYEKYRKIGEFKGGGK
ncbi:MAG: acetyl-CoA carboxylase carboxyltransferase subunit alpha [Deltaproteobacteria bacterium]|nr:MAG: acetyl-CoA carboxylase carboxyltransferase subunit alpha [Deltaproteobacteria bacterium]